MQHLKLVTAAAVALTVLITPVAEGKSKVISFSTAKKHLYTKIYDNKGETFYCGCDWSKKKTDLNSCGLQSFFPKKQRKRAARTEAEHLLAASWLLRVNGKLRQCAVTAKKVGESARDYCQKHDDNYKQAHNDLVNLQPAVGQINADRSNKPFVAVATTKVKKYASCDVEIGSRGIVPPKHKQGDIARIAFYMHETYGLTYSVRQLSLFNQWDKEDPITKQEIEHNKRVVEVQGFGIVN
jgi:deoxyribonuclease-1